jgi:adenylate cyclase
LGEETAQPEASLDAKAPGAIHAPAQEQVAPHAHGHAHEWHMHLGFLEKFKRRNVGRVAILYVVIGYLVLETFGVFFHLLSMPAWVGQAMVVVVALGFPIALLFAWAYEITPEGLKPSHEVHPAHSIAHHTGRRLDRAIFVMMAAALAYFITDKFWLSHRTSATTAVGQTASATPSASLQSIAVLPFVNLSSDKEQEYFADGLAEELLDLLAKTPGLHVVARTSSFSFKGKSDDIPTIAAKLKVAHVLEGSVRKSANRLRVTTELVRAADGEQLWSETYDRELKDIFKVQDEIAAAVAGALKLKLAPGQESLPSRSTNTDAYLQYLLGQQYFSRGDTESYRRSVAAYKQAIALDPNYAAAYASLSLAEDYLADALGDSAGMARSREAAERAIALAPDQPMGYAARGDLRFTYYWDWMGAQADLAKALELGPNDPFVLRRSSILLRALGNLHEGVITARKSTDVDPYSTTAWTNLATTLICLNDHSGARQASSHALAIEPSNLYALNALGTMELLDRRPQEALAVYGRINADDAGDNGFRLTGIAMAEHDLGHALESKQALEEAIAKAAQIDAYQIAQAYAWTGQTEQAFAWLERAYRQRDGGLAQAIKTDPLLASIKSDPRYAAMLKKIHLD